ncbi:diphthine--ammonia ligase [Peribacillus deserti]|uniref:ATP-binding protein n=1 Tax=Peribacillus deserti TaxID=673318 RepID=A0A2N5M4S2_9BACI|nr:diphthine--ammonia ligase [Peribacillus deserti]PLT29366.1 ATP-binding protein [Peribacillus deserti]
MREKIVLAFSSGKDSAVLLHELQTGNQYEVVSLVTTCTKEGKTTSHHIDERIVEEQAESIGLPLYKIKMDVFNAIEFEDGLINAMNHFKETCGVTKIAYGDLFLEDVRVYKEQLLEKFGFQLLVPLWGRDTSEFVCSIVESGWKAVIAAVDTEKLTQDYLGKTLTKEMIDRFPANMDPCGENGEYHTFVYDGPIFNKPISYQIELPEEKGDRWIFANLALTPDGKGN